MNFNCTVYAGGVFSKVMIIYQNLLSVKDSMDKAYFKNLDERSTLENPFDFIYEQTLDGSYTPLMCNPLPAYTMLNTDPQLAGLKQIRNKLVIKKEILDFVDQTCSNLRINSNTLGIHVRLTDMNIIHGSDYGIKSFDKYVEDIKHLLTLKEHHNVYIASDNQESIDKLEAIFGDKIVYYRNFMREKREDGGLDSKYQLDNFSNPQFWIDTYKEMLMLARCGTLLYRVSNFANAAILHSDSIEKAYRM